MDNIKQVTVGIQRVINLGNYENVSYECSCIVEADTCDADEAYAQGLAFCKEKVSAELDRLKLVKRVLPKTD